MSDQLRDYSYSLPEELIAQTPLENRWESRLFVLPRHAGPFSHRPFRDVVHLLEPGDLLVVNDTRVTALRLNARRVPTGGEVELLLLSEPSEGQFVAMAKPGRRLKPGGKLELEGDIRAGVIAEQDAGLKLLQIDGPADWRVRLAERGRVPLPPYIHAELGNSERYQTVYAATGGSAAAPTAGLHFTPEILAALAQKGVDVATVTLSVSIDTFRPVQVASLRDHVMHGETCSISPETARKVAAAPGRIIAVGTTCVRTLETFAVGRRNVEAGTRVSKLFIQPGFEFQVIDGMFTNFHLPETTMMVMLAALVGRDRLLGAYAEAVAERYRFLSFGDSMLIV